MATAEGPRPPGAPGAGCRGASASGSGRALRGAARSLGSGRRSEPAAGIEQQAQQAGGSSSTKTATFPNSPHPQQVSGQCYRVWGRFGRLFT